MITYFTSLQYNQILNIVYELLPKGIIESNLEAGC